jgi:hypothetical protein
MSELRVFAGIGTGSTVRECHSLISERLGIMRGQVAIGGAKERYW